MFCITANCPSKLTGWARKALIKPLLFGLAVTGYSPMSPGRIRLHLQILHWFFHVFFNHLSSGTSQTNLGITCKWFDWHQTAFVDWPEDLRHCMSPDLNLIEKIAAYNCPPPSLTEVELDLLKRIGKIFQSPCMHRL